MSLRPDDRKSRRRSKSPGRERSRSRSHVRAPSPGPQSYGSSAEQHGYGYDYEGAAGHPRQPDLYAQGGEPVTMGGYTDLPPEQRPGYVHQTHHAAQYQAAPNVSYSQSAGNVQYSQTPYTYSTAPTQGNVTRTPSNAGNFQYAQPGKIQFTAKPVVPTTQPPPVTHTHQPTSPQYQTVQPQYSMPQAPQPPPATQGQHAYHPPPSPQHAYPPQSVLAHDQYQYPPPPMGRHSPQPGRHRSASHSGQQSSYPGYNAVEVLPGGITKPPPSPGMRPHSLSVNGGSGGLSSRMERLSVSGNRPNIQTIVPGGMPGGYPDGGLPPPSPLLEAYHGTYQSISPMPQAMRFDDDLDHLQPLDSLSPRGSSTTLGGGHRRSHSSSKRSPSPRRSKHSSKPSSSSSSKYDQDKMALQAYSRAQDTKSRRVKIYDAEQDALDLVQAMATRTVDADTIIDIIPALSHDQLLELRHEYKKHCKVQGRGINIAKHIKLRTTGNFGKIAYVTALGRYESEGYWANYWYQSNGARRELLIEALMGRQNHEMREIKDDFKDKRYSDSLVKCMDKELKADKFRKAILMALEGERQEESDVWPTEYRNRDVDTLYKALKAREGGESVMLEVVVMRSDAHLREVLRTYERKYQGNFARDALRKSNNLVGEVIAHILNGVINRPARDAMLLHHALMDLIDLPPTTTSNKPSTSSSSSSSTSKHERQQRYELLVSRLVRLHWERLHLQRVKMEYEEKYGKVVEEDIEEACKGDFREFCIALCQAGQ